MRVIRYNIGRMDLYRLIRLTCICEKKKATRKKG